MEDFSRFTLVGVSKACAGALIGSTGLWGLVWLLFRKPLSQVLAPWLLYSGIGILFAPALYWSQRRQALTGDWRPFFVVFGAACMAAAPLLFYYAARFGLLSPPSLLKLNLTTVIAIPPLSVATYYAMKWLEILPPSRR